jgi:hypothetical protein
MILTLFAILLALTIILIMASKYIEAPGLQLTGYCFLFLLGLVVLFGSLQYPTGEISNFGYSGEEITSVNFTTTYSNFTNEIYAGVNLNHIIGLFLCITSGLGFAIVLMNLEKFTIKQSGGLNNG